MLFSDLKLSSALLAVLAEEGYTTPTPIQAQAIPHILEGKDMLGCAQTGTGKTAAFSLPILDRLMATPVDKTRRGPVLPRVLILSPTRELATQIAEAISTYGRNTPLNYAVIYGGVSQFHQVRALQRGVDIIVATPGRLMDLMEQGHVKLSNISTFVLDEADRMLDMGFIHPIRRIASALPAPRQTLMFSATMPKPIMHLADSLLTKPVKVSVTPVASATPLVEQKVYMVPHPTKQSLLRHLLELEGVTRAIVFTRTKHGADRVAKRLNADGIAADAIHGNKAQNARQKALEALRSGRTRVLVATDVAARGIDVDGITHVFNFDIPEEPESYVHRIGRTGRAGATGVAISFCDREEVGSMRDIERLTGKRVHTITTLPELMERGPLAAPVAAHDRNVTPERLEGSHIGYDLPERRELQHHGPPARHAAGHPEKRRGQPGHAKNWPAPHSKSQPYPKNFGPARPPHTATPAPTTAQTPVHAQAPAHAQAPDVAPSARPDRRERRSQFAQPGGSAPHSSPMQMIAPRSSPHPVENAPRTSEIEFVGTSRPRDPVGPGRGSGAPQSRPQFGHRKGPKPSHSGNSPGRGSGIGGGGQRTGSQDSRGPASGERAPAYGRGGQGGGSGGAQGGGYASGKPTGKHGGKGAFAKSGGKKRGR